MHRTVNTAAEKNWGGGGYPPMDDLGVDVWPTLNCMLKTLDIRIMDMICYFLFFLTPHLFYVSIQSVLYCCFISLYEYLFTST
jgi:hypothetical protein